MPRPPKAKSAPKDSTANLGYGMDGCKSKGASQSSRRNPTLLRFAIMNPAMSGIEAESGPPSIAGPNTFRRDLHSDLRAGYVLSNGPASAGSSNQSGECPARSATPMPKAKPQSLPRQRDIRQKLIEADLACLAVAA